MQRVSSFESILIHVGSRLQCSGGLAPDEPRAEVIIAELWEQARALEGRLQDQARANLRCGAVERYVRAAHETCLVATRGRFKVDCKSIRSRFSAPVPVGSDGKYIHSGKPEAFFELVEKLVAGPYVELFARRRRPGWICLGNELPPERKVQP